MTFITEVNETDRSSKGLVWIFLALLISLLWNAFLIVAPILMPEDSAHSRIGQMLYALGRPGGLFTERFFPGHSMQQIFVLMVSSVIFYWIVFLFLLSAASCLIHLMLRPRQPHS